MKILTNNKMFFLFKDNLKKKQTLTKQLKEILDEGIVVKDDCIFLNSFYLANRHISKDSFEDKTGYECFINGFHIDDLCRSKYLERTLLFSYEFIEICEKRLGKTPIELIISQTDSGYHFTFHQLRENEIWIDMNDLEDFNEAIFIISIGG